MCRPENPLSTTSSPSRNVSPTSSPTPPRDLPTRTPSRRRTSSSVWPRATDKRHTPFSRARSDFPVSRHAIHGVSCVCLFVASRLREVNSGREEEQVRRFVVVISTTGGGTKRAEDRRGGGGGGRGRGSFSPQPPSPPFFSELLRNMG